MKTIKMPTSGVPSFISYIDDLVCLWYIDLSARKHVAGVFSEPDTWHVVNGTVPRYLGTFVSRENGRVRDAAPTLSVPGLRKAHARRSLVCASALAKDMQPFNVETESVCYATCYGTTVLRRDGKWRINSYSLNLLPVLYRGARGGIYYTAFRDTDEGYNDRRSDAEITIPVGKLQLNHQRLFYARIYPNHDHQIMSDLLVLTAANVLPETVLTVANRRITDFSVSYDGRLLAVTVAEIRQDAAPVDEVRLYEIAASGHIRSEIACFDLPGMFCCFSADGLTLAVVCRNKLNSSYVGSVVFLDTE